MTAQIKGMTQAARNANDGISIAQTTEGALNEINNNLQRVRELSVQAANGSNSQSDLQSIQAEIGQRLAEIDCVSEQTQFNGINVLAKDNNTLKIQVGANDNEVIDVRLDRIDSETLELQNLSVAGPASLDTAADIDKVYAAAGATATTGEKATDVTFTVANGDKWASDLGTAPTAATLATDENGNVWAAIELAGDVKRGGFSAGDTVYVAVEKDDINFTASTAAGTPDAFAVELDLSKVSVSKERSDTPLADIDAALQRVDSMRSDLGAIQNRFQSTIANLSNTVNNLSAARSRIEDADYAVEVSNMTRAQILQQAGTSVLAQANQVPQTVLSLLR